MDEWSLVLILMGTIVSRKLLATIIGNKYTGDKAGEEGDDCDDFETHGEV